MAYQNPSNDAGTHWQLEAGNLELEGNNAPLTDEELANLEPLTNPSYFQTSALDLSDWDVGIQDPLFQQVYNEFMNPDIYSPSIPADDLPAEPHPVQQDVIPPSETPPQSPTHQSPPQSPPPSYALQAGTAGVHLQAGTAGDHLQAGTAGDHLPEWQPAAQLLQLAQWGAIFIVVPRYTNIDRRAERTSLVAIPVPSLGTLFRLAPVWRPTTDWVRYFCRYRLPRRHFWFHGLPAIREEEITQEHYVCRMFQTQRLGTPWRPGPEFILDPIIPNRIINLGSIDFPPQPVLDFISGGYDEMRSWYTDAVVRQVYPLLLNGEFGSQDELALLLDNDDIFHQPSVFPNDHVLFGSRIVFFIMSSILLGTRIHSILNHWEGLAGPAPYVPGFTVALASVYARFLVRMWIYGDSSFTESEIRPAYDRALRVWVNMLQNPEELQKFIRLEASWIHSSR